MNRLMSRTQVADYLNISLASLDRIVMRGELPVIRLHATKRGRVLFDPEQVRAWLQRRSSSIATIASLTMSIPA